MQRFHYHISGLTSTDPLPPANNAQPFRKFQRNAFAVRNTQFCENARSMTTRGSPQSAARRELPILPLSVEALSVPALHGAYAFLSLKKN